MTIIVTGDCALYQRKQTNRVNVPISQRAPVTFGGHGLHVNPPLSRRHSAPFIHGLLAQ